MCVAFVVGIHGGGSGVGGRDRGGRGGDVEFCEHDDDFVGLVA